MRKGQGNARRALRVRKSPPARPRVSVATADRMRVAVTASATELLRPLPPEDTIPKVLQRIGEAVCASRVQTYENVRRPDGRLAPTLRYEWCARGVPPVRGLHRAAADDPAWD